MDEDSSHCTGGSDQNYAKEKEMQKGKVVVWGGFTNNWEQKKNVFISINLTIQKKKFFQKFLRNISYQIWLKEYVATFNK